MTEKEIREAIKLIPSFIKVAEKDLGEDENNETMTFEDYQKVEKLIKKLKTLDNFVDTGVFE